MSAEHARDDLLITRSFDAPAAVLFALWSEPAHFRRWIGPEGFDCRECTIDFRVGGAYRAMIRNAEHGDNWFGGVYREIAPHTRLVFTFKWDSGPSGGIETLVTLTFREDRGRTVQTFHQTPFLSAERRDSHAKGWNSTFDKAVDYAARISRPGAPR